MNSFSSILFISIALLSFTEVSAGAVTAEKKTPASCDISGKSQIQLKSYRLKSVLKPFRDQHIKALVKNHFPYIKKGWPQKCPRHCKQINSYKVVSKIYPMTVNKNSCSKKEAQESYSLKKHFPLQKNIQSVTKAHQEMWGWISSVFIEPYYPLTSPGKEFVDHKLEKACPSCSFYFNYNYRYTKDNRLDMHITAQCGDKKTFLSSFKADFSLINNWKCKL